MVGQLFHQFPIHTCDWLGTGIYYDEEPSRASERGEYHSLQSPCFYPDADGWGNTLIGT